MVDDTIATDIDRIIQIIKKKKHMSLDELEKESGIPKTTLDKWLPMMEDVGLITISYHLTQIYIDWVGGGEFEGLEEPEAEAEVVQAPVLPEKSLPEKPSEREREGEVDEIPAEDIEIVEEKIELPEKVEKVKTPARKVTGMAKPKPKKVPLRLTEFKEPEKKIPDKIELLRPPVKPPEGMRESKLTKSLREKMKEMDKVREELEQLKEQKRKLLEDVYKPMEQKFSVELKTISDNIAEKERRILELQQKVLQLPDTIDELDRQQLRMKEIEDETIKIAQDTSHAVNELLERLAELKEETLNQLENADRSVAEGNAQLGDMRSLMAKIDSIRTELGNRMSVMQKQIEEQTLKLEQLKDSWEKLENIQVRTEERIARTEELLNKQKEIVDDLEDKISRTEQLEQWLRMHQENYEKTFNEFLAYVHDNQIEFNRLRETLEANFVRRYLKDLEQLSEGYEFEMKKAQETERSIDEKIDEAKNKLKALLKQSRALVDAFEKAGYEEREITVPPEELLMEYEKKGRRIQRRMKEAIKERKQIARKLREEIPEISGAKPRRPKDVSVKKKKPKLSKTPGSRKKTKKK